MHLLVYWEEMVIDGDDDQPNFKQGHGLTLSVL